MDISFKDLSNKQIAKNSLFLYIRMALIMIMSLISVRVILRALHVEDYGIYNAIGGVVTSLSFLSTALAGASQRFFSYSIGEKNVSNLNKDIGSILFGYVIIIALIIILAETFGEWFVLNRMNFSTEKHIDIQWVFQFSLVTFIINLMSAPLLALIIAHEDMRYYSIISISDGALKLFVAIVLYIIPEQRLIAYPGLLMMVSIITLSFYYIIVKKKYPYLNIKLNFEKNNFKRIFSFSSWSCFGAIANVCYHQGINILFNIFAGPIANAAFAIANQVNAAITTFGSSFFLAVRPGMIKSYAQNNYSRLNNLYLFSSKMIFALLFIVMLPLLVKTDYILNLWLGEVVEYMVPFTRIIIIASLIMSLGLPITTIIQATGKNKYYHMIVDGFISVSVVLIYFALKIGLAPSFSLSISIIIYMIAHYIRLVFLKKLANESINVYIKSCLFPMATILIMNWGVIYIIDCLIGNDDFVGFILIFIISLLVNLSTYYLFLINKTERLFLINHISRMVNRIQK